MSQQEFAALDSYQLLPKLLYEVQGADTSLELLNEICTTPILPRLTGLWGQESLQAGSFHLVSGELLAEVPESFDYRRCIPLMRSQKMGVLVPQVRDLVERGIPALALDLTTLAETPPYGHYEWRPRTREDLAELRAAAGLPLWLYGVCSPQDADVAMEAGLEAIVVHAGAGRYLGGPATIHIFPDIFDAVAGVISVHAGGPVRNGIDVFRYLALGAEAVVVESDRSLAHLQAELEYAMRLTGCQTLADIGYEAIFAPLFGES